MINTDNLKDWMIKNNIEKRSIEYFWKYIDMYMDEVDDDYSNILKYINLQLVSTKLFKASLSTIYEHPADTINVFLDILYMDEFIGVHEIIYTLSTDYIEEYLKFDDIHYLWRLAHVYRKIFEIGKIALEEGADVEFVSKTTGLSINQIKEYIK